MSASDTGQPLESKNPPSCVIFGCGYLGNRVAKRWYESGQAVISVSRNLPAVQRPDGEIDSGNTKKVGKNFAGHWTYDQLATQSDNRKAIGSPRTVLFCAGMDGVENSENQWLQCLRSAISFADKHDCRFLFTSSTGVYGQDDGQWVDETDAPIPTRRRAKLCVQAENEIRHRLSNYAICRLAGIYGPGRLPRLNPLKNGEAVPGNPRAWLNLIMVDDAAMILDELSQIDMCVDAVNIADGVPIARQEYFRIICQIAHFPPAVFDETALSDSLGKRISVERLRGILGKKFRPTDLETGLSISLNENSFN
jgi:nucleoside-diphosphate-sugar epimerase